jgi:hypothetical protein
VELNILGKALCLQFVSVYAVQSCIVLAVASRFLRHLFQYVLFQVFFLSSLSFLSSLLLTDLHFVLSFRGIFTLFSSFCLAFLLMERNFSFHFPSRWPISPSSSGFYSFDVLLLNNRMFSRLPLSFQEGSQAFLHKSGDLYHRFKHCSMPTASTSSLAIFPPIIKLAFHYSLLNHSFDFFYDI